MLINQLGIRFINLTIKGKIPHKIIPQTIIAEMYKNGINKVKKGK